jgi:hypothetical protein
MEKTAKIIREITVAPAMALLMLIIIYIGKPDTFGSITSFICSILFLTVLPIMAYPLQKYIPGFKDRGREGQRSLAMIFAVSGYILGCIANIFLSAPKLMWIIYLEYLFSGILILIFNKCFHLSASGHACGVVGPIALLIFFGIPALLPGMFVTAGVYFSSLKIKRHNIKQLIGGTIIPVVVILLLAFTRISIHF